MSQVLNRPTPPMLFQPIRQPPKPATTRLQVVSEYEPAGDQPTAIKTLVAGVNTGERDQVLLGVTGSGKTFTMAKVIEAVQKPTLILAPNKTLAAQLYGEMKSFFPHNAVEYFVSYYDYYQPEAYVPRTDTYIEKDSQINEQIDRMRHAATQSLLERNDVVIVASVSCIYGIGSVETYSKMVVKLETGGKIDRDRLAKALVELQYRRNDVAFARGTFRLRGEVVDIYPAHYEDRAWRVTLFGDEIESLTEFDPLTGEKTATLESITVYANSHYVTPRPTLQQAVQDIKKELKDRLDFFVANGKLLEAERLQQKTTFDMEMIETTGSCKSIENYSRYLSGRNAGEPPPTLFEYLPENALLIIDESHVTVPQIGGMERGDYARKSILADYGFRLPSCIDNRPLKFAEWESFRPQTLFVSATPGPWEMERTAGVFAEQVIRPTGLIDPVTEIRPVDRQVDDLLAEIRIVAGAGARVLVTVLTKRMAEDLTEYLNENGVRVRYLHSDVDTLERIEIIRDLRVGVFDVLVGINLLREGLDIHRPRRPQHRRPRDPLRRPHDRQPALRHRGNRTTPKQTTRLEHCPRHHPPGYPPPGRQDPRIRLRTGLRHRRPDRQQLNRGVRRQGPESLNRRDGKAHARRRRRSRIRGSRPPARRDQTPRGTGPRSGTAPSQ